MGLKIGTLREIGAKKGDVVTFDENVNYRFAVDRIEGYSVYGHRVDGGESYNDSWLLDGAGNWRIVSTDTPTGPVRTVTRTTREIVPGVYDGLDVGQAVDGHVFIAMGIHRVDAEAIDALIAHLTVIRDALEDV